MGFVGSIFHQTFGSWRYRTWEHHHCLYCTILTAAMKTIPGWQEDLKKGLADSEAGRLYRGRLASRLPSQPSSSWLPDDPQQPAGWHHDGQRWRLNRDGGWWVDRYGFWRYNKPGQIGWVEQPDRSWCYDESPA
jgi:hypothetical protein